ncbi:hypothetical protein [Oceanobacillus polygoni]|uniref:Uncharacterized protein n=1 Tax=Oceanobacillus polygoni TaxID=1235259 RepID=A0A9X1CE22_9BACI|nr:hypothetical protein [Oceanobacillus polygoni]MBP2079646.1 hypothetical protein [Oceanobacillus polygoni]
MSGVDKFILASIILFMNLMSSVMLLFAFVYFGGDYLDLLEDGLLTGIYVMIVWFLLLFFQYYVTVRLVDNSKIYKEKE